MEPHINNNLIQELLKQAEKDDIRKIVVRAVIRRNNKFLFLERASSEFLGGFVVLPGGSVDQGEDILDALTREVKEETNLTTIAITTYLGLFDYASSSGKKTRQFNFFIKTEPGDVTIDISEHSRYFWLNPSDGEFTKFNISDGTKKILEVVEKFG